MAGALYAPPGFRCFLGESIMDDAKRTVYQRLVQASLLMEEASTQATRAAAIASNLRRVFCGATALNAEQIAAALDLMHDSVQRSSSCTHEAFALIKVA